MELVILLSSIFFSSIDLVSIGGLSIIDELEECSFIMEELEECSFIDDECSVTLVSAAVEVDEYV